MSQPLFSVVIPTFNREHVVLRAVKSVLQQAFPNFELIIVDDGSTDRTPAHFSRINDPRVKYIYQNNAGVSSARHTGAKAAKGMLLTFLDSDDWAYPDWLESFAKVYNDTPYLLAFCGSRYCSESGDFLRDVMPRPMGPLFKNIVGQNLPGGWVVDRQLYHCTGGFNPKIGFSANSELIMRVADECEFRLSKPICINKILVRMEHRGSRSIDAWKLADAETFIEIYQSRFNENPVAWSYYLGSWGAGAARLRKYSLARKYFRMSIALAPLRTISWLRLAFTYFPVLRDFVWKSTRPFSLRNGLGARN